MPFDRVGRYAGSRSHMQGSSPNRDNEEKTNIHGWMLYSVYSALLVYAVLGVNS